MNQIKKHKCKAYTIEAVAQCKTCCDMFGVEVQYKADGTKQVYAGISATHTEENELIHKCGGECKLILPNRIEFF